MPIEQTEKFITDTLQAPINNMVIAIAGLALLIVLLVIVLLWKATPFLAKFLNSMMENIQKLTALEEQNSKQSKDILEGLNKNTTEMAEQTNVIKGLSRDTRSYQTLVSDTLSGVGDEVKNATKRTVENSEAIARLTESVETSNSEMRKSIDELTEQIKRLSEKDECVDVTIKWAQFKEELIAAMQQPTQAVATNVVTIDATSLQDKAA